MAIRIPKYRVPTLTSMAASMAVSSMAAAGQRQREEVCLLNGPRILEYLKRVNPRWTKARIPMTMTQHVQTFGPKAQQLTFSTLKKLLRGRQQVTFHAVVSTNLDEADEYGPGYHLDEITVSLINAKAKLATVRKLISQTQARYWEVDPMSENWRNVRWYYVVKSKVHGRFVYPYVDESSDGFHMLGNQFYERDVVVFTC